MTMKTENKKEVWRAVEKYDGWAVKIVEDKPSIGDLWVCQQIEQGRDGGKSHAKLIASAPLLLANLEQAKVILEVIDSENPAIKQIEYAISQATK